MAENEKVTKSTISADRLLRGVLTKIGDTFDQLTGRRWKPSSSLAASELIARLKTLLDTEARNIPGKGLVVPHNIQLKMQWDKFSTDSENSITTLENELLTAAVDHINDKLYYTYAPLTLEIKLDYFTEGVKLLVGFERFDSEQREVEMNVTVPSLDLAGVIREQPERTTDESYVVRYVINGISKETTISARVNGRISVGRTTQNSLMVDDPSVSKIHAALVVGPDGSLSVADTGSTNGTFVNGERISYGKAVKLDPNDTIKFGTVEVSFERLPTPDLPAELGSDDDISPEKVEIGGFEFSSRTSGDDDPEIATQLDTNEDTLMIEPEKEIAPQSGEPTK